MTQVRNRSVPILLFVLLLVAPLLSGCVGYQEPATGPDASGAEEGGAGGSGRAGNASGLPVRTVHVTVTTAYDARHDPPCPYAECQPHDLREGDPARNGTVSVRFRLPGDGDVPGAGPDSSPQASSGPFRPRMVPRGGVIDLTESRRTWWGVPVGDDADPVRFSVRARGPLNMTLEVRSFVETLTEDCWLRYATPDPPGFHRPAPDTTPVVTTLPFGARCSNPRQVRIVEERQVAGNLSAEWTWPIQVVEPPHLPVEHRVSLTFERSHGGTVPAGVGAAAVDVELAAPDEQPVRRVRLVGVPGTGPLPLPESPLLEPLPNGSVAFRYQDTDQEDAQVGSWRLTVQGAAVGVLRVEIVVDYVDLSRFGL